MENNSTLSNKATNVTIDADYAGQRIDNYLFNKLKNVPTSRVYKMLRSGEVRVNKGRIGPSYKLQPDDIIRVPPFWSQMTTAVAIPGSRLINLLVNSIIFEDDKILVINKPSGIAAHSGSNVDFGVIEILRAGRKDLKNLELVHRIDKDTSGCLILAKTRAALNELHQKIRDGELFKRYLLLVRGKWEGKEQTVDAPLLKTQLDLKKMVVSQEGKESITIFRPIRTSDKASLLEADLKTGRTHQIRVHAAHIGHPIAGDNRYGDKEFNKQMKEQGLKRLFLHAKEISFQWSCGAKANIVAPLDPELNKTIKEIF